MSSRASRAGRRVGTVACAAALAGCVAGPDYVRPPAPALARYTAAGPDAPGGAQMLAPQRLVPDAPPAPCWWRAFGSAPLDALVAQGLAASPTLQSARAASAQAQALLAAARGEAFPQATVAASAARTHGGTDGTSAFDAGPAFTFDLDPAGAVRRRVEQAGALADVQRALWQGARLELVGGIVAQAIALAAAGAQIAAAQDIVAVDRRNLELVRISAAAGKSAQLDVLTAQSQLDGDLALLPPLERQADAARHALAVLVGQPSSAFAAPAFTLAALRLPRDLPLVLPARLARSHPDIRAAEAQLHAANAALGVATAQRYPGGTLSAHWTASAATLGGLVDGGTRLWNIAADILAPVFNGGTLAAQRDAAVQAYVVQLGNYRQALLQVFGRVADALAALGHDAALVAAETGALDSARAALDLTQESYRAGQASLPQLLEAQRLYQQARLGAARAAGQRHADTAQLFVALGGTSPAGPEAGDFACAAREQGRGPGRASPVDR